MSAGQEIVCQVCAPKPQTPNPKPQTLNPDRRINGLNWEGQQVAGWTTPDLLVGQSLGFGNPGKPGSELKVDI